MSYQLGYDPVSMAAYLDATGASGVDANGMTVGGAPAAQGGLTVATKGSYGVSVGTTGTAFMVVALVVGAYCLLHFDRVKGAL